MSKPKQRTVGGPRYNSASKASAPRKRGSGTGFGNYLSLKPAVAPKLAKSYLGTILWPGSISGCKIPDFNLYPTVTAHTETENTFATSASGDGGVVVRIQGGGQGGNGWGGSYSQQNNTTTTAAAFTYYASQSLRSQSSAFFNSYLSARLVSASVECQYVGNDNNNQGRMATANLVRGEYVFANYASFASILQARDNLTSAITDGSFVRYRPLDEKSFEFKLQDDATSPDDMSVLIAITGAAANAPFRFKIVCNWECIVKADTFDQPIANNISPSPSDPQAMNISKQAIQQIDTVQLLDSATVQKNGRDLISAKKDTDGLLSQIMGEAQDVVLSGVEGFMSGGPAGAAIAAGTQLIKKSYQALTSGKRKRIAY